MPFPLAACFLLNALHAPNSAFRERLAHEPMRRCIFLDLDYVET